MTTYEIRYTKIADKFFTEHEEIRLAYEEDIRKLIVNDHPESVNVKRIRGKHAVYWRIREGGYRIIYTIINNNIIVIQTMLAGSRGDIYKKMGGLH